MMAPGDDGGGDLMGLGGGQDEDRVRWWLLQGFEKGVEGVGGHHVYLVHNVDLVLALHRGEVHLVADAPYLVDATVAGGVHLDEVHGAAKVQVLTLGAEVVGLSVLRVKTVEGLGQDSRGGGLAGAPGPAEEIGVGYAALPPTPSSGRW